MTEAEDGEGAEAPPTGSTNYDPVEIERRFAGLGLLDALHWFFRWHGAAPAKEPISVGLDRARAAINRFCAATGVTFSPEVAADIAPPTTPARGPTGVWRNPEGAGLQAGDVEWLASLEHAFGGRWTKRKDRIRRLVAALSASPPLLVGDDGEDKGAAVAGLPSSQEGSDTRNIRQAGKED